MIYIKYLKYVVVHKFWVGYACFKAGLFWRGIKHDLSKFLPSEYIPYARFFNGKINRNRDKTGYYKPTDTGDLAFDFAWLKHQKRSDHHWQWWILPEDEGGLKILEMSEPAVVEMLCDWWGAGKAQKATSTTKEWFEINSHKMQLHPETKKLIEIYLDAPMFKNPRK